MIQKYIFNTTNDKKFEEYKKFGFDVERSIEDIPEIVSDPYTLIIHKAKLAGKNIIVEDTSFDVEGADIGINIKYKVQEVKNYIGNEATERVLLAVLKEDNYIYVYEAEMHGKIIQATTAGWAYEPYFMPHGSNVSLAQHKPDHLNARKKIVNDFIANKWKMFSKIPEDWDGEWQK